MISISIKNKGSFKKMFIIFTIKYIIINQYRIHYLRGIKSKPQNTKIIIILQLEGKIKIYTILIFPL